MQDNSLVVESLLIRAFHTLVHGLSLGMTRPRMMTTILRATSLFLTEDPSCTKGSTTLWIIPKTWLEPLLDTDSRQLYDLSVEWCDSECDPEEQT